MRDKRTPKDVCGEAIQTAAPKSGEFVGKKAGDKIIQLLRKRNKNTTTPVTHPIQNPQTRELRDYEINERVNKLLSGGRMREIKFIESINRNISILFLTWKHH